MRSDGDADPGRRTSQFVRTLCGGPGLWVWVRVRPKRDDEGKSQRIQGWRLLYSALHMPAVGATAVGGPALLRHPRPSLRLRPHHQHPPPAFITYRPSTGSGICSATAPPRQISAPAVTRTTQARPVVCYGPRSVPARPNPARRNPPKRQGSCSPAKRWCPLPLAVVAGLKQCGQWAPVNARRCRFQTLPSRSLTSGSDWPVRPLQKKGCPRLSMPSGFHSLLSITTEASAGLPSADLHRRATRWHRGSFLNLE